MLRIFHQGGIADYANPVTHPSLHRCCFFLSRNSISRGSLLSLLRHAIETGLRAVYDYMQIWMLGNKIYSPRWETTYGAIQHNVLSLGHTIEKGLSMIICKFGCWGTMSQSVCHCCLFKKFYFPFHDCLDVGDHYIHDANPTQCPVPPHLVRP